MKVAYVVPRYGLEVIGGAEYGARMLAERLVSMLGWEVEALTTCALDARTWDNHYPAGSVDVNGVTVRRFHAEGGRDPSFESLSQRILPSPESASAEDQERWIDLQGPRSAALIEAVEASSADIVIFYPYLYHPTVRGMPRVSERAVFHPAAHDEQPIRLPLFKSVFGAAQGLVFQTDGERRLVEERFAVAHKRHIVLGLGVEERVGDEAEARSATGVGDRPYLLFVGRIDDGKGTALLARYFASFKDRHPGPLQLVLAGGIVNDPPHHPDIILPGAVDDDLKWGLYRGATAFVHPSPFEAFSIVLMEAWTAGLPVVVNGACLATREHAHLSGGGLWFDGYASFEAAVERILADPSSRERMASAGAAYVRDRFSWPVLIERYKHFLEAVLWHR